MKVCRYQGKYSDPVIVVLFTMYSRTLSILGLFFLFSFTFHLSLHLKRFAIAVRPHFECDRHGRGRRGRHDDPHGGIFVQPLERHLGHQERHHLDVRYTFGGIL